MKFFGYIEHAVYINLDYRTDRRIAVEQRFNELGLEVERFNAIQPNPDELDNPCNEPLWHKKMGCTQSHFQCIRLAKERQLKNIWIMEDDVVFVPEFLVKVQRVIDELKTIEWDMCFLGGEPNRKALPHSEHLVKTNGVYGAHSYFVNHTFYDKLLKLNIDYKISDTIFVSMDETIKKFFLSKEILCFQDDQFESDLWGGKVAREHLYKNAYKLYVDGV
jgi:GR25 family glycosyltransferase involved in LPS biosynthesis